MFKNIFLTSLRFLKKNILFTLISVLSLSIGISATLVIFIMIHRDYSYDKHVQDRDLVFRVVSDGEFKSPSVLTPLNLAMKNELPSAELVVPLLQIYEAQIKPERNTGDFSKDVFPKENGYVFSDATYFGIYPQKWLGGSAKELDRPSHVVLSENKRMKYFPNLSPEETIGKVIQFDDDILLQVSGVFETDFYLSDFKYDAVVSMATIPTNARLKEYFNWEKWNNYNSSYQTLLKLKPQQSVEETEAQIANILKKYKNQETEGADKYVLQPLADVHFNPVLNYKAVNLKTVRNLVLLAIFLLVLGAINFINLSTAQASERAKEIGIRKTLGSRKSGLIRQFLLETFLITFGATVFSILLMPVLLKAFEGFISHSWNLQALPWFPIVVFLIIQILIVTALAGLYPAWVITGFSPIQAIKDIRAQTSTSSNATWIRKGLIVTQFIIAQVFLIGVVIVSQQIRFVTHQDMGFRKEAIVTIRVPDFFKDMQNHKGLILQSEMTKIPEIKAISLGNISPATNGMMSSTMNLDNPTNDEITFDVRSGDENYLEVYQIPLITGRNIRLLDKGNEVLINEKMLDLMQVRSPEEAVGKTLDQGLFTVVGVMKNFHIGSARTEIRPMMYMGRTNLYILHIALDPNHPESWKVGIDKMSDTFKKVYPDYEFEYSFVDEDIAGFYEQDLRLSKLLSWSVGLSALIAGLGLFGLVMFVTIKRSKEIGVRKVLGASVLQIIYLLVKQLLGLVLLAIFVAIPIAWYFMQTWLNDFVYRTEVNWWIFAYPSLAMLFFAALVLSFKTFQVASANPVNSLRDE